MTELENEKRKFRRVLLVCLPGDGPHDWLPTLQRYADDVTLVSLDNPFALDYLQLPADCVVSDSRIRDIDLFGVGLIQSRASRRGLRALIFYDERPGWDINMLQHLGIPTCVHYLQETALDELEKYLEATPAEDYERIEREAPWLMEPWTVSLAQVEAAGVRSRYSDF